MREAATGDVEMTAPMTKLQTAEHDLKQLTQLAQLGVAFCDFRGRGVSRIKRLGGVRS
jgi:hypothetical protein